VSGHAHDDDRDPDVWYQLKDEMTDQIKGYITPSGETKETDAETTEKIRKAFDTELIVKENEVVEELGGVCFDGVCTITPNDPGHNMMVLRNLGALTGLRPAEIDDEGKEPGDTR
jgi:hypothetical protein